jgi:cold shock CspA family protein
VAIATDQSTYEVGHRVRMSMTLDNEGASSVYLASNANGNGFTVFDGSTEVWHSARNISGHGARTLKPGQAIKVKAVWSGKLSHADSSIAPGTYSVVANEGGYSGSTTLQITQ